MAIVALVSVAVSTDDAGVPGAQCVRSAAIACNGRVTHNSHNTRSLRQRFMPRSLAPPAQRSQIDATSCRSPMLEKMKRFEVRATSRERDKIDDTHPSDQHEERRGDFDGVAREHRDERQPDHEREHRAM